MSDEIKEILEELKEKNETYKECSENGIIENEYYKSHILLDYITNLQQEKEDYKSRVENAVEYIKWQQENPQYDNVWRKYECESLINILQGSKDDKLI